MKICALTITKDENIAKRLKAIYEEEGYQIYIKEKLCYFTIYSNKELRNFLCEYFRKKHWDRCEK